jgi:hypothetical protein
MAQHRYVQFTSPSESEHSSDRHAWPPRPAPDKVRLTRAGVPLAVPADCVGATAAGGVRSLHSLSEIMGRVCLVQMPCRPRQRIGTAAHVQPRERVRKNVGLRLARPPEFRQLIAVDFPVGAHPVSDERRQVHADTVALGGCPTWLALFATVAADSGK